jgi:hypothetical protein
MKPKMIRDELIEKIRKDMVNKGVFRGVNNLVPKEKTEVVNKLSTKFGQTLTDQEKEDYYSAFGPDEI